MTAAAGIAPALLSWFDAQARDLPWREVRDPWAILVAETMSQQTQVARVVPRWSSFLDQWPTAVACAAAPLSDVLRAWQGLGYPRRARNLHAAAGVVAHEHAGHVPDRLEALLRLPGVGPYTARAVLAFAFERDVGVLDVNASRVLARAVAGAPLTGREGQRLADAVVPPGDGWRWNQAVLDLGATVCTRRAPDCERCPVSAACAWRAVGGPGAGPDPADTSGVRSRPQARFEGSDRQARGRLLAAAVEGPVPVDAAAAVTGRGATDADRLVVALLSEGLLARVGDVLVLPGDEVASPA